MKTMTATEAGRNFSAAVKIADSYGLVNIEKKGKDGYVLMNRNRFDETVLGGSIYGVCGDDLVKISYIGEGVKIYQLLPNEAGFLDYRICDIPADLPLITRKGEHVTVSANLDAYEGDYPDRRIAVLYGRGLTDIEKEQDAADTSIPQEAAMLDNLKEAVAVLGEFEIIPEDRLVMIELDVRDSRRNLMDSLR